MSDDEVYCPGQVKHVLPHVPEDVAWFLLAGPADGDEAQVFAKRFPSARIVGFEPNPQFFAIQETRGFPGTLLPVALWDERAVLSLASSAADRQSQRGGSVVHGHHHRLAETEGVPLDDLSDRIGPFSNAVLWLDVKGAEERCLRGASRLLTAGAIRLVNVEAFKGHEHETGDLLRSYGFREVGRWGAHVQPTRAWCNIIYGKDSE